MMRDELTWVLAVAMVAAAGPQGRLLTLLNNNASVVILAGVFAFRNLRLSNNVSLDSADGRTLLVVIESLVFA